MVLADELEFGQHRERPEEVGERFGLWFFADEIERGGALPSLIHSSPAKSKTSASPSGDGAIATTPWHGGGTSHTVAPR